jgi:hypothetical protein
MDLLRLSRNQASPRAWLTASVIAVGLATPAAAQQVTVTRAGWSTTGIVLPQGTATQALKIGSLPTQTDVKVRWPDGSIRHALITALLPRGGTYPVASSTTVPATAAPILPVCSAKLLMGTTEYLAQPGGPPSSVWLSGDLVVEGRWLVPFGSHPVRRLRLDERHFQNGAVRCDFSIENALNVPQTNVETYDVELRAAGNTVYRRTGVVHGSFARWRYVYWKDGQDAEGTPDLWPFQEAKAIPSYMWTMKRDALDVPALPASGQPWVDRYARAQPTPTWDILDIGDAMYPMWNYGGRPDIGPYPEWVAQFVVFHGSGERNYMLRMADAAGAWGTHVTETNDRVPSVEAKPDFWLLRHNAPTNGTNGPANNMVGIKREYEYSERGSFRPEIGSAHQPSFAYVPYLVTGDRFYADEMRFWANDALISWNPSLDGKPLSINDDEQRGTAWGLRDLVDASVYLPDGDQDKAYFGRAVSATLADLDTEIGKPDPSGFGAVMIGRSAPTPSMITHATQMFLAWSLSHALDQGATTNRTPLERLVTHLIRLYQFRADYPDRYIPSFRHWVMRADGTPFRKADGSPDYKALWAYNFDPSTRGDGHMLDCCDPSQVTAYEINLDIIGEHGPEIVPGLAAAIAYGVAGAQQAYDVLLGYTETNQAGATFTMRAGVESRSQFAVTPTPRTRPPSPPTAVRIRKP